MCEESKTEIVGTFQPIFVSELLNGKYVFNIPSYQRGYRWGNQEVTDLLEDLYAFVTTEAGAIYFLQPLVVRAIKKDDKSAWEVLDGQQRLTTMLLILKRLCSRLPEEDKNDFIKKCYCIEYANRPAMDFDNPNSKSNIDAYHVANAKRIIDEWVNQKLEGGYKKALSDMVSTLFYSDNNKQVSFIWYVIDEDSAIKDSIGLFNRLNKGKIKLTGAELIKALFILANKKIGPDAVNKFAFEWDEIVRKLQDDSFWYFLSAKEAEQTRMDVLFDFVTGQSRDDKSYREFQKAYDAFARGETSFKAFDGVTYSNFTSLWQVVTHCLDDLIRWYEDVNAYNYVGWLCRNGYSLSKIKQVWAEASPENGYDFLRDEDHYRELRKLIREKLKIRSQGDNEVKSLSRDGLVSLTYTDNYDMLKRILLLFNIESTRVAGERFRFDLLSKEKGWDLEHVDSQTDNALTRNEDQIEWLGFVLEVLSWMDETDASQRLKEEGNLLQMTLKTERKNINNQFGAYYAKIADYFSNDDEENGLPKDSICNLTILDCGTNRSYKNAPFPYKRFRIIDRGHKGGFVPECTKELFLKGYSDTGKDASQIDKFRWSSHDQLKYFDAICARLSAFIDA